MHVHTHVCTHNTHANTRIHTHKSTKLHCQHEMTLLQNYFHKPMPAFCGKCCVGLRNSNIKLRSKLTLVQPWPNAAPGATSGPQSYFCGPWPVTLGRVGLKKHSVLAHLMVVLENSIPYREMHCMAWVKWPSV